MRCFIALRTDGSERAALAPWLERARGVAELAVTPAANLHLTVAFLGELEPGRAEAAAQAMSTAAGVAAPGWRIHWAAPGYFPGASRPRVLWLGVDDREGRLARVQVATRDALAAAELAVEARAFRPHLTLARVRRPALGRGELGILRSLLEEVPLPTPSAVQAVALFQSHLGGGAARHELVAEERVG